MVRDYSVDSRPKLLYEVSYDHGLTWAYWGDLYRTEPEFHAHLGSIIIRLLNGDTAIAVYHREPFIGVSWLHKKPADSREAAKLTYAASH